MKLKVKGFDRSNIFFNYVNNLAVLSEFFQTFSQMSENNKPKEIKVFHFKLNSLKFKSNLKLKILNLWFKASGYL